MYQPRQSWNGKNVYKVMPYQDSGDCSVEPGSLSSFRAKLDFWQEHMQVEWFINKLYGSGPSYTCSQN